MTDYETIIHVRSEARARVLIAALRAHGFSPREIADGGLPGVGAALGNGSGRSARKRATRAAPRRF